MICSIHVGMYSNRGEREHELVFYVHVHVPCYYCQYKSAATHVAMCWKVVEDYLMLRCVAQPINYRPANPPGFSGIIPETSLYSRSPGIRSHNPGFFLHRAGVSVWLRETTKLIVLV